VNKESLIVKLHFSFTTEGYENSFNDYPTDIKDYIEKHGVNHRWNSCSYFGTEILVSNLCFIPGYDYEEKIFYNIIFEEDPKNVFVEVKNNTDPRVLCGISTEGIELFNQFNNLDLDTIRYGVYERPNMVDIFIDPLNTQNEIYGFCVDKIKFDQILEINIMYTSRVKLEVIKTIYKKEI
jgi:hypothetical protein